MAVDGPTPLFVYGTLRPGGSLFQMIKPALVVPPVRAQVVGFSLYAARHEGFPYMMHGHEDSVVQGSILMCREGTELTSVVHMELGAGYKLVATDAHYRAHGQDRELTAIAFVLPSKLGYMTGEYIMDGDWLEWAKARRELYSFDNEVESVPKTS